MQIKLLVSAAAIALVAGLGSASAAEQFTALDGVTAVAMSSVEQDAVRGSLVHFTVTTSGKGLINPDTPTEAAPLAGNFFRVGHAGRTVGPGYNGLCVALGNGTIGTVTPC